MKTSLKHIKELRDKAKEWGLDDQGLLDRYTDRQLAEIYNGIGPESFPAWIRNALDSMHPTLEPVALIHDLEWSQPGKADGHWKASNQRFRENGVKAAKARYPWWNIARYKVMRTARLFSELCGTGIAYKAYLAGGVAKDVE